ncbi:DUF2575 domain-containing protein, partial [Escherichia coli]
LTLTDVQGILGRFSLF